MERRKFLIGAGSLAAGSAAAMGTGAFSFVRADRTMDVTVASDKNAYLALTSQSEYASGDTPSESGEIKLQFDGSNQQNGSGLNANADSRFDEVFSIENQGTNNVKVSIQDADASVVTFYYSNDGESATFDDAHTLNAGRGIDLPVLEPTDTIDIHMIFWLRDDQNTEDDIPTEVGIVAEEA